MANDCGRKVWDAQTGIEILTLGAVTDLSSALTGNDWPALSGCGTSRTGQELLSLSDAGYPLAFSLDGHRLASNGPDGTVKIWDAIRGVVVCWPDELSISLVVHSPQIHFIA